MRQQAIHQGSTYYLVNIIVGVIKHKEGEELKIKWMYFENDDDTTWELLDNIGDDLPNILEVLLHTLGNRILNREIISIPF